MIETFEQNKKLTKSQRLTYSRFFGFDSDEWESVCAVDRIMRWQHANGILDGKGNVGPKTRERIAIEIGKLPMVEVPLEIGRTRDLFGCNDIMWLTDISKHQSIKNWDLFASRQDAVYIKATHGASTRDPKLEQHVRMSRSSGLKIAALYHYAQHFGITGKVSSARKGAENLYGCCEELDVKWGILDLEPDTVSEAIEKGWKASDFEVWSREFVNTFTNLAGNRIVIYCGGETLRRSRAGSPVGGFDWLIRSGYPIIVPGYLRPMAKWQKGLGPIAPINWPYEDFIGAQYRGGDDKKTKEDEGGKAEGVDGDVDCNWIIKGRCRQWVSEMT